MRECYTQFKQIQHFNVNSKKMTKQKKSFFEKLTGIRRVEEEDGEMIADGQQIEQTVEYDAGGDYEVPQPFQASMEAGQPMREEAPSFQQPVATMPEANVESVEAEGQLTIDVYQTDEDVVIKSTIAGVKPEDLDVNINNDMVTIKGDRTQDEEIDPENYYYQECYWGPFSRSVILPVEIVADKAEATMKNGILTLRLPKADTTKSRKIQVRGY